MNCAIYRQYTVQYQYVPHTVSGIVTLVTQKVKIQRYLRLSQEKKSIINK